MSGDDAIVRSSDLGAFLLLCLIWGSTWLGIKAGLETVPPLFLAGTRFTVAGLLLSAWSVWKSDTGIAPIDVPRLLGAAILLITLCYGLLFWGMQFIDSGTAAVLEMGLTPIALLGFALAFKEEQPSVRRTLAILLGIAGLIILFGPTAATAWAASDASALPRILGAAAVASAAIVYGYGSVVSRPLLRRYSPALVAGTTTLVGGIVLVSAALVLEPGAVGALDLAWGVRAWIGWLFLVIFGSLIGYTLYMRLLRDIGATRAGMYAFVSPVVAVLLGAWFEDEPITALKLAGVAVLLMAAWLAMWSPVEER